MLQPIQTKYKGYNFRSRLEARWAVFFDVLQFNWEYEVEGFNLSSGEKYLPDFKVTSPQNFITWYDVKPSGIKSCEKLKQLQKDFNEEDPGGFVYFKTLDGDPFYFFYEKPPVCLNDKYQMFDTNTVCPRCGNIDFHSVDFNDDQPYFLCEPCDLTTPCGSGNLIENGIIADTRPHKGGLYLESDIDQNIYHTAIMDACNSARSSRFEHGQTPISM